MNTHNRKVEDVSDIVQVLNSGIEFYKKGIEECDDSRLTELFGKMITARQQAVSRLQPFAIREQGEAETGSSFAVTMKEKFAQLTSLFRDTDESFIKQLEEMEDKTLEVIKDALEEDQPADCRQALMTTQTEMQQCHDQMKGIKDAIDA